jgi:ADP-ribosylglycohydrolase
VAELTSQDRYRGCLLGLATGDALGTTLEFKRPGTFEPIDDMIGGGPFDLEAGQWTDDTSMALCLAESLVECQKFDPVDQMERYVRWWRKGHMSSTGLCFDIGGTTSTALAAFEQSGDPYSGPTDARSAGNGSIMRLAPVPMFADTPAHARELAAVSSRTTHGAAPAVDACRYFAILLSAALSGLPKEILLSPCFVAYDATWIDDPLCEEIQEIANGSFWDREPPEIRGTGYVVQSLEAALWAFRSSKTFEEGCLMAVNLGDDADTTGAVYGQLAGAYYGAEAIPQRWRAKLRHHDLIVSLADRLHDMNGSNYQRALG